METIALTRGKSAVVDHDDLCLVQGHKWFANRIGRTWYAGRNIRRDDGSWTTLYMHRHIATPPEGFVVDHIDTDGLNNRRSNLRFCTRGENAGRQKPQIGKTSRFKGVCWYKSRGKWTAYITHLGRCHKLGYFLQEDRAALAYNAAASRLFGEFAILNVI